MQPGQAFSALHPVERDPWKERVRTPMTFLRFTVPSVNKIFLHQNFNRITSSRALQPPLNVMERLYEGLQLKERGSAAAVGWEYHHNLVLLLRRRRTDDYPYCKKGSLVSTEYTKTAGCVKYRDKFHEQFTLVPPRAEALEIPEQIVRALLFDLRVSFL